MIIQFTAFASLQWPSLRRRHESPRIRSSSSCCWCVCVWVRLCIQKAFLKSSVVVMPCLNVLNSQLVWPKHRDNIPVLQQPDSWGGGVSIGPQNTLQENRKDWIYGKSRHPRGVNFHCSKCGKGRRALFGYSPLFALLLPCLYPRLKFMCVCESMCTIEETRIDLRMFSG